MVLPQFMARASTMVQHQLTGRASHGAASVRDTCYYHSAAAIHGTCWYMVQPLFKARAITQHLKIH